MKKTLAWNHCTQSIQLHITQIEKPVTYKERNPKTRHCAQRWHVHSNMGKIYKQSGGKKPDSKKLDEEYISVWSPLTYNSKQDKLTDAVKSQDSGCLWGRWVKDAQQRLWVQDHVLFINMVSYRVCSMLYTYDMCIFLQAYFSKKFKNLKSKHEEPH